MKRFLIFVLAALGFVGIWLAVPADQHDERLSTLFERLSHAADAEEARLLEIEIWGIWTDSGREDVNALMKEGIEAMQLRNLDAALAAFNKVVKIAPDFAEGWNKRATVYYLQDNLADSVRDVQHTLALEPRHFGALSGLGLILMEVGDDTGALKVFEEVLKIHPNAPGARYHSEALRAKIRNDAV